MAASPARWLPGRSAGEQRSLAKLVSTGGGPEPLPTFVETGARAAECVDDRSQVKVPGLLRSDHPERPPRVVVKEDQWWREAGDQPFSVIRVARAGEDVGPGRGRALSIRGSRAGPLRPDRCSRRVRPGRRTIGRPRRGRADEWTPPCALTRNCHGRVAEPKHWMRMLGARCGGHRHRRSSSKAPANATETRAPSGI
jgi:hypothetical protein